MPNPDDMTLDELYEAAKAEAPDEPEPEPVHDDVDDCPRCGSDQTGRTDNPNFPRAEYGCNDCLYLWP